MGESRCLKRLFVEMTSQTVYSARWVAAKVSNQHGSSVQNLKHKSININQSMYLITHKQHRMTEVTKKQLK